MTKEEFRALREQTIKILYIHDLLQEDLESIYRQYPVVDPSIRKMIEGISEKKSEIDIIIENNLENYNLNRLGYVDRAIIRTAVYEMMNGLDPKIAINEAVDLSKIYTQTEEYNSAAFNNKLLDKIAKDLQSGK